LSEPETQTLLAMVFKRIKDHGAQRARDFEDPRDSKGLWWDWKPAKSALEHLFSRGDLLIANRIRFERVYDLTERVLPDWVDQSKPSETDTALHVLERSARALGICTPAQVADYCHDYGRNQARLYIEQLIEEEVLIPVQVAQDSGGSLEMVVHKEYLESLNAAADGDLEAERTTFLSPFDSLFYPARRDEQLWSFRQVLEAYKPAEKRIWGYYCLPILYRDQLVGRLDPRLDRKRGRLHLEKIFLEPGVQPADELMNNIKNVLKDFMDFHNANDVVIEASNPKSFGKALQRLL
jgi:uncharacterized protein YcaQ